MATNSIQQNDWHDQAELALPNSAVLRFRARVTHTGVFHEAEMQLVWQRAGKSLLAYRVGRGHATYAQAALHARPDQQVVWLAVRDRDGQDWQAIASLDLASGEFHDEGDFRFPRAEPAWATIHEEDGVLVEEQLTWTQDDESGIQRLFDHERGIVWERSAEQETWRLKLGTLETAEYPCPGSPYPMARPAWLADLAQNSGAK